MDTENITVEQIKLTASTGKALHNGTTYARIVYLAKEEDKSKWQEVDEPKDESTTDIILDTTTLEGSKAQKIAEITAYDCSDAVNALTYKGVRTWLTAEVRNSYLTSIQAAELLGETSITFDIGGQVVTLELQSAKIMLAKLQRYADASYLVTQQHIAEVSKLTTVAEVTAYDITAGYPTKLTF